MPALEEVERKQLRDLIAQQNETIQRLMAREPSPSCTCYMGTQAASLDVLSLSPDYPRPSRDGFPHGGNLMVAKAGGAAREVEKGAETNPIPNTSLIISTSTDTIPFPADFVERGSAVNSKFHSAMETSGRGELGPEDAHVDKDGVGLLNNGNGDYHMLMTDSSSSSLASSASLTEAWRQREEGRQLLDALREARLKEAVPSDTDSDSIIIFIAVIAISFLALIMFGINYQYHSCQETRRHAEEVHARVLALEAEKKRAEQLGAGGIDYLKNVFVRYMQNTDSATHEALFPVICTLLKVSEFLALSRFDYV
jgi:hypothetical protein